MKRRSPIQLSVTVALCGLVALVATGLPVSHRADHQSDMAHLEHDHGGHGTVVLEQDEQLLTKLFSFSAVRGAIAAMWTEAGPSIEQAVQIGSHRYHGRDPPLESKPRAPPSIIS